MTASAAQSLVAPPWVRITLPPTPAGIATMADHCGWETRPAGPNAWDVRQRTDYGGAPIELLRFRKQVTAQDCGDPRVYAFLATGAPQDQYDPSGELGRLARDQVQRILDRGSRVDYWQAFALAVVGAPDTQVADWIRELFQAAVQALPDATLWSGEYHPWLSPRLAVARTLFGLAYTPDRLAATSPDGIMRAGSELGAVSGFALGPYIDALLLALAPWLPGISSSRAGGAVVLAFGNLQAGRSEGHAELMELYRPHLLSNLVMTTPIPEFDPTDFDQALRWWGGQISRFVTVALDPAAYRTPTGEHDAAAHFATLLSIDRLLAAVNSVLVGSRREEFARTTLMYEALDIITGLTYGRLDHGQTLSYKHAVETLAKLEARLPDAVQRIVLPRCRTAVRALNHVVTGFFDDSRHHGGSLSIPVSSGRRDMAWDRAVTDYLRNTIRNGAHSYRERLANEVHRQLFASHTGAIPPELADLAYLYFLDLFTKPEQLTLSFWNSVPARAERRPVDEELWEAASR